MMVINRTGTKVYMGLVEVDLLREKKVMTWCAWQMNRSDAIKPKRTDLLHAYSVATELINR